MNLQHERIDAHCQSLKLDGLMQCYRALAGEAATKDWNFLDCLEHSLAHERDTRQVRSRQTPVRMAGFPAIQTLDDYDYGFAVGAPKNHRRAGHLALHRAVPERCITRPFRGRQNPSRHCHRIRGNSGRHQDQVHHRSRSDGAIGGRAPPRTLRGSCGTTSWGHVCSLSTRSDTCRYRVTRPVTSSRSSPSAMSVAQ